MSSTLDLPRLVELTQSRWAIAVLAELAARDGARFAELLAALGIARESLVRTLEGLVETGWVARNTGYGHPLRPEYVLTARGTELSPHAIAIEATRRKLSLQPADFTRWSLPVVRSIKTGASRFNELSRTLPAAQPRALSQCLKSLALHELVARDVIDTHPPVSIYLLTRRGARLAAVV